MCQINFSINATDSDGTIVSAEGRYKLSTEINYTNTFTIPNINAAVTPDIQVDGVYDLQIRVLDNSGDYSNWTTVSGFSVGNCSSTGTTTFSNTEQSQTFTRNDCREGDIGGDVIYTVSAGTYTSTISQADADQQAINDIQANGQTFANNNGTCTPAEEPTFSGGLIQVADCNTNSGTNVFANWDDGGDTIGDVYYSDVNSTTPFAGGNNFYRQTGPGTQEQFYSDFNQIIISDFIVQIDNNGAVVSVQNCNS